MNSVARAVQNFARLALNFAQHQLSAQPMQKTFCVAGQNIGITESERVALDWLDGQFTPQTGPVKNRIYADYSNWASNFAPASAVLVGMSELHVDEYLAAVNLRGSFYGPLNRWEFFDPESRIGIRLQTHPSAYPEWEPTAPFANFLNWIMMADGKTVLHAATLGLKGKGVLIAGPGGSGKSGTTLAGILHGLSTVGDDYVVVDTAEKMTAYPFFHKIKQDVSGLSRVGLTLNSDVTVPLNWQNKYVFDVRKIAPDAAVDRLNVIAVLLPEITNRSNTTFSPASAFEILQALAPSTMKQLGGDRRATFRTCAEISRNISGYHLHLGTNPAEISARISEFIGKAK